MNNAISNKTVSSTSFDATQHTTFIPSPGPPLPTSLSFTVSLLAGSLARAMALSTANMATIGTLTQGFHYLLDGLIDPSQPELAFVQDIETIGDSLRTAFSWFLGAGIADLYMSQLGHAFRCNGRELFRKKGRIFDFAYDGGPLSGNDVVAVEAKGLVRRGATAKATTKATKRGYETQVDKHVGTTLSGATIVRGYAIGIGCRLKKGAKCHLHVEQTAWGGSSVSAISPSSSGTGGRHLRSVRNQIALRNFRAVFRLMGNRGILDAIDASLNGQPARLPGSPALVQRRWRNHDYYVSVPDPTLPDAQQVFHSSFGVRCDALTLFLDGLPRTPVQDALTRDFPRELLVEPPDVARESTFNDGGAEFPDGLAYFGRPSFPVSPRFLFVGNIRSTG